jgi:hypothetical protein
MNPSSTELMQAFVVSHGQARFDDGRFDGVLIGLCFASLVVIGVGLLGMYHSSLELDYHVHAGAIPQIPQTRSTVITPVIAQGVSADSSSTDWRG